MQPDRSVLENELGRDDDGQIAPGPPGATRWPKGWEVTKERHSSSPRVASAGAMNMTPSLAQGAVAPRIQEPAGTPSSSIDSVRCRV